MGSAEEAESAHGNADCLPDSCIDSPGRAARSSGWGVRVHDGELQAGSSRSAPHAGAMPTCAAYPDDEVVDAAGQALSPGFVDAHTHLYGVLAHGIPLHKAPSGFWPFLVDFWWPLVEDRLDHEMICAATDLNLVQMLRGGTTSFYDITEAPHALPGCLARPGRGRGGAGHPRHPLVRGDRAGEQGERPARAAREPGVSSARNRSGVRSSPA